MSALVVGGCVSDDPGVVAEGTERAVVDSTASPGTTSVPETAPPKASSTTTTSTGSGSGSGAVGSSGNPTTDAAAVVALWPDAADAFVTFANQTCSVMSSVSFWANDTEGWNATRRAIAVFGDLAAPPSLVGHQRDLVREFTVVVDRAEATSDTIGDDTDPTNVSNAAARDAGLAMCVAAGPDGRSYSVPESMFDGRDRLDATGVATMVDFELDLRDPFLLLDAPTRACVRSKARSDPELAEKLFLSGLTDEFASWAAECGTTVTAGFNHLEAPR